MLKLEKTEDGRVAKVEGAPSDIMMFYCIWKTKIWPGCFEHRHIGKENDRFTKEASGVAERIRNGDLLALHDVGKVFENAFHHAVEVCTNLGIEVRVGESVAE